MSKYIKMNFFFGSKFTVEIAHSNEDIYFRLKLSFILFFLITKNTKFSLVARISINCEPVCFWHVLFSISTRYTTQDFRHHNYRRRSEEITLIKSQPQDFNSEIVVHFWNNRFLHRRKEQCRKYCDTQVEFIWSRLFKFFEIFFKRIVEFDTQMPWFNKINLELAIFLLA